MRIYIVRHGETEYNKKELYMTPDIPLSQEGVSQAKILADRFKNLKVDLIISSSYLRAKQTTEIINKVVSKQSFSTNKEVEVMEDLKEIVRPSYFHHKSWHDPEIKEVRDRILENWHQKDWRHSDEENFQELLERALRVISKLETIEEENVLLVTHEGFMKVLIATLMFGEDLEAKFLDDLYNFLRVKNTGITIVEKHDSGWKLITWNDHAHLG